MSPAPDIQELLSGLLDWAAGSPPSPALVPYLARVPSDGDPGFWVGEVLDVIIRDAALLEANGCTAADIRFVFADWCSA